MEISFFTSGTTGQPKEIRHSLDALMANAEAFNKHVGLGSDVRMYHILPMQYMAGYLNTVLCPMMAGGIVIRGPQFNAQAALDFWDYPRQQRANTMWLTPTIALTLAKLAREPVETGFERIFCGTAPLSQRTKDLFHEKFGIWLQESYGTTELMLVSAQTSRTPYLNAGQVFRTIAFHGDELIVDNIATGDLADFNNDCLKIIGRKKDITK